jgi:hypothetical protein
VKSDAHNRGMRSDDARKLKKGEVGEGEGKQKSVTSWGEGKVMNLKQGRIAGDFRQEVVVNDADIEALVFPVESCMPFAPGALGTPEGCVGC